MAQHVTACGLGLTLQSMVKHDARQQSIQNLTRSTTTIKQWQSVNTACKACSVLSAEVLDSCKKVENQLISFAAVGVSMDEEAVREATATCQAADKTIQVVLLALSHALIPLPYHMRSYLLPYHMSSYPYPLHVLV